ncbi:MAG: LysR family transcriptional regulator [Burkholderiales bacterium]|jgi:DNA-binding transcriptional LysR family regulator|nr:MAG: LysR family transcriptional regulator [Burkholderiales bacterium]
MDTTDIDWNLYRAFLAVMREGSLSAAARALGSTQPSVGRHIAALEEALGTPLFTRGPGGLKPTATALELQGPARAMATAAQHAVRVASGSAHEHRGTVRITASQIIGGEVLPELLARYQAQHPLVTLELVLNNKMDDLLKREADIAVRMERPGQQALIAKRMGRVDIGLYAHQRYVRTRGLPRNLVEMSQHALIGADQDPIATRLGQQKGIAITRDMFTFRCDNDLAQIAAIRAGMGIGGMQIGLARRDPDLLPVLPESLTFNLDMWLVMHGDQRQNQRVMSLFRYLTQELSAYAASSQRAS